MERFAIGMTSAGGKKRDGLCSVDNRFTATYRSDAKKGYDMTHMIVLSIIPEQPDKDMQAPAKKLIANYESKAIQALKKHSKHHPRNTDGEGM